MRREIFLCFVIWAGPLLPVSCERQNVSLVELSKCQQYQTIGYGYKHFFIVEDLHHIRNESDLLHIRVAILAGKDAHILLSDTNNPTKSDNVVEIVLGAGSNTYCEIRRRMGFHSLKSRRLPSVLSYVDPMAFVVRINQTGYIDVRYEGDEDSLINAVYSDFNVSLSYISFCCWGLSTCKFFFDCPNSLYDNLAETNTPIGGVAKLEEDLFLSLNSQSAPFQLQAVELSLDIFYLKFDQMQNTLKTVVKIWYQWTDPKMVWDPENYENIREHSSSYDEHRTWVPILKVEDGVGLDNVDTSSHSLKSTVFHNGTVRANSKQFQFETWCAVDFSVKIWPHEQVTCNLNLSLGNAIDTPLTRMVDHAAIVKQNENSEWSIASVNMTLKDGRVIYRILLKRNESFIGSLFGTPLIFALLMLVCSVFVRQSMYRMVLVLLVGIVLVATLMTLSNYVPPFYIPLIVQYYCVCLGLMILALICNIISQHFVKYPPKAEPPRWIVSSFKSRILNYVLCFLPESVEYNDKAKTANSWQIVSSLVDGLFVIAALIFGLVMSILRY